MARKVKFQTETPPEAALRMLTVAGLVATGFIVIAIAVLIAASGKPEVAQEAPPAGSVVYNTAPTYFETCEDNLIISIDEKE